jgi:hypothetical protein
MDDLTVLPSLRNDGQKKPRNRSRGFLLLAERTGLEPATLGVTGRYSNQLNYRSMMVGAVGIEPTTLAL